MQNKKIYILLNQNGIVIKSTEEKTIYLDENDLKLLNLTIENTETLTEKDGKEFISVKISDLSQLNLPFQLVSLRSLLGNIDEENFHIAAKAFHIMNWNEKTHFCSNCGTLVKNKADERAKICSNCGFISYPTICPAIITAIINNDKILLAHNTHFPKNLFSVIAGFVEPGESFEECVKREVFEEIGIHVKNIKYFGSQPWPFPSSLMVAFICEYESGELSVDGVEIDAANWYHISEMPQIPSNGSIARKLIDWFCQSNAK